MAIYYGLINCSPPDVTVPRLPVQFLPVQFCCILVICIVLYEWPFCIVIIINLVREKNENKETHQSFPHTVLARRICQKVSKSAMQGCNSVLSIARKKWEIKILTRVQVQTRPKTLMKQKLIRVLGRVQDWARHYRPKYPGSRLLWTV